MYLVYVTGEKTDGGDLLNEDMKFGQRDNKVTYF